MTGADAEFDVIVVGGGPAGSTISSRLAQFGHRVVMIDRGAARRSHRFETLAAGALELLDASGAGSRVRSLGSREVGSIQRAWDGPPTRSRLPPGSLVIDRERFDAVLREHAAGVGVVVRRPCAVTARVAIGDRWSVRTDDGGSCTGRFLVDATGRPATRRSPPGTLAVTGTWRGEVPHEPVVATTDDGWVWCAPSPDAPGACEVTAFVDAEAWRSLPGGDAATRYDRLVHAAAVVGAAATRAGRLRSSVATAAVAADPAGATFLRVGDAATALDPLSASGLLVAVRSALTAAVVVHTALASPADAALAIDHHRRSIESTWRHHATWTAEAYAAVAALRPTSFWQARVGDDVVDPTSPSRRPAPGAGRTGDRRATPDRVVRRSPDVRFVDTTHVLADRIAAGPAIEHPGLDGAVAYVGGTPIVPLLRPLVGAAPLGDIVDRWAETLPLESAVRLAAWLLQRGVLEGVDAA